MSLDLRLDSGTPHPPADLRILPAPTAAERDAVDAFCQRSRTSAALLPDPRSWCAAFVQGLLEVLAGTRAPQQLLRWCDEAVYADISRRARAISRRSPSTARPAMRSLHVSAPSDGVIEATAIIQVGRRCRAIAIRLDGLDGRWRASALEIL